MNWIKRGGRAFRTASSITKIYPVMNKNPTPMKIKAIIGFKYRLESPNLVFHSRTLLLDKRDNKISGVTVPSEKISMIKNDVVNSLPCAAKDIADPKVGPTQGAHTSPRTDPKANCPHKP